ncbi:MAG: deoxyribose-phosphate aldolase [Acidobacteria bacterium]|nr:deoxyribose-phosphate aldolase [Acidobacteriota bacterium]MBI3427020.1 deoxyribose-phosphate aldolase [Acidobacteriota bacterium]
MNPELEKLIEQITDQILARLGAGGELHSANGLESCSPHHIACAIQAGATRIGLSAGQANAGSGDVARFIDHTLLKPEATRAEIETLCQEARQNSFASVCVNPYWVKECAFLLHGSPVKVCTVVGFPLGATTADVKAYETRRAIFDGATEIDMVINIGALRSGDDETVKRDMRAVVEAAHEACAIVKTILETALLTDDEKVRACVLAKEAGADFVKTSTGFSKGGATVADIELMRRAVGANIGVKAAGGVRDLASAKEMIAAGATRIGASAGVKIVQEAQGKQVATAQPAGSY